MRMWVAAGISAGFSSRTQNRVPSNAVASFHPPTNTPGATSAGLFGRVRDLGGVAGLALAVIAPVQVGGEDDLGAALGRVALLAHRGCPHAVSVVDARVRVHHPCPYCDLSVEFPRTLFLLWCDNRRDTFLISSPDEEEARRTVSLLRRSFRARLLLEDGPIALVELPDFEWPSPPSVTGLARRAGVWVLPPVVYAEGRETYRFVSSDRARLNRLIRRVRHLGEVEILSLSDRSGLESVRDYPTASVHFFEGLSDRQTRSLVAAHDAGLLEIPARESWAAVARREGLSRSTFGEHLRKAQLRILRNSYVLLKARAAVSAAAPVVLPQLGPPAAPERTGSNERKSPPAGARTPSARRGSSTPGHDPE
jgi:predicted DNA binding protein